MSNFKINNNSYQENKCAGAMSGKKSIGILLTRHYDWTSKFIYCTTGFGYTHASIGLGENNDCFYSFNFKGFCTENTERWKQCSCFIPSLLFQLNVSEEEYLTIENSIEMMKQDKKRYHYSRIGVLLCLLHIPHRIRNHYFCSQFVAELLVQSGGLLIKKKPSLCLPNTFIEELKGNPKVQNIIYNHLLA